MIIYSKKIVQFVSDIKQMIKTILSREIQLKVFGDRFYDRLQRCSYPIKVVIYNDRNLLGYFDPEFYELGFNECLMPSSQLQNVIRHELAHYITFINHGVAQAHGSEFHAFCERFGWGKEVCSATVCLEGENHRLEEDSVILRKVQKLMALASSSNENESEQAMIKSQQLLLKHNLDSRYLNRDEDEKMFLKRIMKQKKIDAKMQAIAQILETFLVNIVYSKSTDHTYLEILGTKINLEIADYVAGFLNTELDRLWQNIPLRGTVAKNSFFLGLAKGYTNKVQALKRDHDTQGLLVIEKQLTEAKAMVYHRLKSTRSSRRHCSASSWLGEQAGKALTINPAISKPTPMLLK